MCVWTFTNTYLLIIFAQLCQTKDCRCFCSQFCIFTCKNYHLTIDQGPWQYLPRKMGQGRSKDCCCFCSQLCIFTCKNYHLTIDQGPCQYLKNPEKRAKVQSWNFVARKKWKPGHLSFSVRNTVWRGDHNFLITVHIIWGREKGDKIISSPFHWNWVLFVNLLMLWYTFSTVCRRATTFIWFDLRTAVASVCSSALLLAKITI